VEIAFLAYANSAFISRYGDPIKPHNFTAT
jgi:hypothetical protein